MSNFLLRYFRGHFDGSERRISRSGKVRVHGEMRERGESRTGQRRVPLNPHHPFTHIIRHHGEQTLLQILLTEVSFQAFRRTPAHVKWEICSFPQGSLTEWVTATLPTCYLFCGSCTTYTHAHTQTHSGAKLGLNTFLNETLQVFDRFANKFYLYINERRWMWWMWSVLKWNIYLFPH